MLPEAAQARKAIWEAVNPHTGKRRIDEAFPRELRTTTRENEMLIKFANGATWQVVGSDNYDSLVGSPPVGVVFSEWALADPQAWAYIRPILRENNGWALFITTPRGRNHAAQFYEGALPDDSWFAEKLTARQTGVFTPEDLDQELREYVREYGPDEGEARFNQEYLCDFHASIPGAYYGRMMNDAEEQGRIREVRIQQGFPVHTAWDIGRTDDTAIWFFQTIANEVRLVDFYRSNGEPVAHYVGVIKSKGYDYGKHWLPHDAVPQTFATNKSIVEHVADPAVGGLGWGSVRALPSLEVEQGIEAVRSILPRCWFDREKTALGIEALREYRRDWDEKNKVFRKSPLHNWASHAADAFRYLAMAYRAERPRDPEPPTETRTTPQGDVAVRVPEDPDKLPSFDEIVKEHERRHKRRGRRRI